MVTWISVNIGLGNGLLPDGTKPLPEPMLTYRHCNYLRTIFQEMLKMSVTEMCLKILIKMHWGFFFLN